LEKRRRKLLKPATLHVARETAAKDLVVSERERFACEKRRPITACIAIAAATSGAIGVLAL